MAYVKRDKNSKIYGHLVEIRILKFIVTRHTISKAKANDENLFRKHKLIQHPAAFLAI